MERETVVKAYDKIKAKYKLTFDLKKEQTDAILATLNKKSSFILLPTGFGKSYCFILPPLLLDEIQSATKPHIALVVSPLRSLMINQVDNLQRVGIKACAILQYSEMKKEDIKDVLEGKFSVIFISPESSELQPWRGMLKQGNYKQRLCVVACDEAHCISQWGLDFRPKYRNVSILRSLCSRSPFAMLTATCSEGMKAEILECLLLQDSDVTTVAVVPDRPNIFLSFSSKPAMKFEKELAWFTELLREKGRSSPKTVIYCRKIGDAANIYEYLMCNLKQKAWSGEAAVENRIVEMYHSSISKGSEKRVLEEFPKIDSNIRCVISTIAFGMAVQVPDIEMIIHWGASKNVLSYMQEIGRCARDGRQGKALLYAHLKSLDKRRTEEDMVDICKHLRQASEEGKEACMRLGMLERLTLEGMDLTHLEILRNRKHCNLRCSECKCVLCTCCSLCRDICPCN